MPGSDWWFTAITAVVNLGFAIVVGVYLLTKAIPKMQDDQAKMLESIQSEHTKEIQTQRVEFMAELKTKREESRQDEKDRRNDFKEALKIIADHCEREGERRDKVLQIELSNVIRTTEEQSKIMEEVRNLLVQFNGRK